MKILLVFLIVLNSVSFSAERDFYFVPSEGDKSEFVCSKQLSTRFPLDFRFAQSPLPSKNTNKTFSTMYSSDRAYRLNQGSVVKLDKDALELLDNDSEELVKVKVVKTAHDDTEENMARTSRTKVDTSSYGRRANEGLEGYINEQDLKEAKDLTYVLKKDSPILQMPELEELGVVALRPKMQDNHYQVEECCMLQKFQGDKGFYSANQLYDYFSTDQDAKNEYCFEDALYDIVTAKSQSPDPIIENFNISTYLKMMNPKFEHICLHEWDHVQPLRAEHTDSLLEIIAKTQEAYPNTNSEDLIYHHGKDMVQMPFDESTCKYKSPGRGCEGPFGSFYYNPDRSSAPGIDQFINAEAGCTFMEVLKYWNKNNCPEDNGCRVQFGDMYHKTTWGDHSSHHSGNCIDVRPMRKKSSTDYGFTRHDTKMYDREKTQEFVNLLNSAGASMVLFGDSKIKGRKYASHHDDHVHVCFGENEEESDADVEAFKHQFRKKVCSKGLEAVFQEQQDHLKAVQEARAADGFQVPTE